MATVWPAKSRTTFRLMLKLHHEFKQEDFRHIRASHRIAPRRLAAEERVAQIPRIHISHRADGVGSEVICDGGFHAACIQLAEGKVVVVQVWIDGDAGLPPVREE